MSKRKLPSVKERRNLVLEMMLKGSTKQQILEWFNDEYPDLSKHSLDKDVTFGYNALKNHVTTNAEDIITEHILYYDQIAKDAKDNYMFDTGIKAKQAKEKLLGLHKPDTAIQVNNNSLNLDLKDITLEELKKLLNE